MQKHLLLETNAFIAGEKLSLCWRWTIWHWRQVRLALGTKGLALETNALKTLIWASAIHTASYHQLQEELMPRWLLVTYTLLWMKLGGITLSVSKTYLCTSFSLDQRAFRNTSLIKKSWTFSHTCTTSYQHNWSSLLLVHVYVQL